jgi:CRISPR-associated protein Cmr4
VSATSLLFIQARSPLHAGTGQGVNGIDLPIAREKATNVPYLPGSSIKGSLRDLYLTKNPGNAQHQVAIFGPDTNNADAHAGAVQVGDARLLFLPVRSLAGTFALVTSPFLLERYQEDALEVGISGVADLRTLSLKSLQDCRVSGGSLKVSGEQVMLEDLDLIALPNVEHDSFSKWLEHLQPFFPNLGPHFCVVHDDVMSFLLETATEIVARIRMESNTKTVANGGLWYEENLPAESVLYSLLFASHSRDKRDKPPTLTAIQVLEHLQAFDGKLVQFGGKATVGRGLCKLKFVPEKAST